MKASLDSFLFFKALVKVVLSATRWLDLCELWLLCVEKERDCDCKLRGSVC